MSLIKLLIIFNLLSFSVFSQTKYNLKNDCYPFSLTVRVNNLDTSTIRIMYAHCNDSSILYTSKLKNGVGKFEGFINNVSEAVIIVDPSKKKYSLDGPNVIRFILEPKAMNLFYSKNSLGAFNVSTTGSKTQTASEQFEKLIFSDLTSLENIVKALRDSSDNNFKEINKLKSDSIYQSITTKIKKYVSENKNSYLSPYMLKKYKAWFLADTLKIYYASLTETARNNSIGKGLLEEILRISSKDEEFTSKFGSKNFHDQLKNAKSFFDFTLIDNGNDQPYKLNSFKNQYTFVNLWASWCPPCVKNIPAYEKLKTKYKDQQINFVAISVDKDEKKWKKASKQYKLTGTNLLDIDNIIPAFYEIQGFPRYLIIGPDGEVLESNAPSPGNANLTKIINSYLSKNQAKFK